MFFAVPSTTSGVCNEASPWPSGCVFDLDPSQNHLCTLSGSFVKTIRDRQPWHFPLSSSGSVDPKLVTWEIGTLSLELTGSDQSVPPTCYLDTGTSSLPGMITENNDTTPLSSGGDGFEVFLIIQGYSNTGSATVLFFGELGDNHTGVNIVKDDDYFRCQSEDDSNGSSALVSSNGYRQTPILLHGRGNDATSDNKYISLSGVSDAYASPLPYVEYLTGDCRFAIGCRYWIVTNQPAFQWTGKIARIVIFNRTLSNAERDVVSQSLVARFL